MDSTVEFIHVKFFSRPDAQIKWKAFLLKNIHTLFLKRYKGLAKSHSQTVNYHVVWGKCSQTSFKFEVCLSFMTFFNWISIPVSLHTFFLLFWWKKENSRYLWGTFVLLPVFFFLTFCHKCQCFTSRASIFYSPSSLNFNILSIWYIFFLEIVQYWLKTLLTQCWDWD